MGVNSAPVMIASMTLSVAVTLTAFQMVTAVLMFLQHPTALVHYYYAAKLWISGIFTLFSKQVSVNMVQFVWLVG